MGKEKKIITAQEKTGQFWDLFRLFWFFFDPGTRLLLFLDWSLEEYIEEIAKGTVLTD